VVGTGAHAALPVMDESDGRPFTATSSYWSPRAIEALRMSPNDTNAILHVTC